MNTLWAYTATLLFLRKPIFNFIAPYKDKKISTYLNTNSMRTYSPTLNKNSSKTFLAQHVCVLKRTWSRSAYYCTSNFIWGMLISSCLGLDKGKFGAISHLAWMLKDWFSCREELQHDILVFKHFLLFEMLIWTWCFWWRSLLIYFRRFFFKECLPEQLSPMVYISHEFRYTRLHFKWTRDWLPRLQPSHLTKRTKRSIQMAMGRKNVQVWEHP